MNVQGKITRKVQTGNMTLVEIEAPTYQAEWLEEFKDDELLNFKVTKAKSKKTVNQNNTAWMLMNDIAKKESIFPDTISVYLTILKMAKIKTTYYQIPDTEPDEHGRTPLSMLEKTNRAVSVIQRGVSNKGVKILTVEIGMGMSHFERDEMREFIDKLLYYAEQVGIDTRRYNFE